MAARVPEAASDADAPLVERARGGDRAAFDELVTRHLAAVWRVVRGIVRHDEDARDVTQDVFITAWQSLPGFRGEARFTTWLHQIAVTRALNFVQRAAERVRRASKSLDVSADVRADVDGGPAWELAANGHSPLSRLEARDLLRRLAVCLERLPPDWRAVLALRDAQGLAYEEIAEVARIALGTVRSRLSRAREALRACLDDPRERR